MITMRGSRAEAVHVVLSAPHGTVLRLFTDDTSDAQCEACEELERLSPVLPGTARYQLFLFIPPHVRTVKWVAGLCSCCMRQLLFPSALA